MIETASVVIVGGGVIGTSIAYHLAQRAVRDTLLVEKHAVGAGATGKSSAIVRQHYTIEVAARTALLSLRAFQRFDEEVGGHSGFVPCGYLIGWAAADAAAGRANVAMQQALGIRTELVDPDETRRLLPGLHVDDLVLGAWEPESGYADPVGVASAYAARARELGVRICQGEAVVGIDASGGRIAAVRTERRTIATPVIVNAAGLWAPAIGGYVGVEIPINPIRHQVAIFKRPERFRGLHPVFVDTVQLAYLRPEGSELLLVGDSARRFGEEPNNPDVYVEGIDEAIAEDFAAKTIHRLPVMEEGALQGGYSGLYDMTPDGQFIVDRLWEPEGFYVACGFSGHGFKHSPAIGRLVAELIVDGRASTVDIGDWRLARFAEGKLLTARHRYSGHVEHGSAWT